MDYLGPLEPSIIQIRPGHNITARYILVIQDSYSRFMMGTATETADGANTVQALESFFTTYGLPASVSSDNGSHFRNHEVASYLAQHGVQAKYGIPHHPESQARVERQMANIQRLTRSATFGSEGTWASHVPWIFHNINCSVSRSIGVTPYEAFMGTAPPTALSRAIDMPAASANNEHERQTLAAELSRLIEQAAGTSFSERSRTHARQRNFITLRIGDYVALWIAYQRASKLEPYVDIRRVRHRVSDSAYIIEHWNCSPNGTDENQTAITCHIDRLNPIAPPRNLPMAEANSINIRAVKDGRGIVEHISSHRNRRGRSSGNIELRIHWVGIDAATESANEIKVWIPPSQLTKCKLAQEYLTSITPTPTIKAVTVPTITSTTATAPTPTTVPHATIASASRMAITTKSSLIAPTAPAALAQSRPRATTTKPIIVEGGGITSAAPRRSGRALKPKRR